MSFHNTTSLIASFCCAVTNDSIKAKSGVPFSNGDKPKDFQKAMEWEQVKRCSSNCKVEPKRILTDKEKDEAKKREEWRKSLMPKEEQKPAASSNPLRDAALNRQGRGY